MFPQAPARAIALSESLSSSENKVLRKSMGRKSKVLKENVEVSQGSPSPTVSLAHLPVQKQSTKIRKRLLVDNETSPGDQSTTKKHKIRIDESQSSPPTLSVLSALRVPPLHRTLSDKSSYLNHSTAVEPSSTLPKSQSTLSSWRRSSQSPKSSSDGEDADDEDEDSLDQAPSTQEAAAPTQYQSPALTIPAAAPRLEPIVKKPLSIEGEIFGSDTTLTSPEDDSDEEPQNSKGTNLVEAVIPPPSPSTMSLAPRRGPGRPRKTPQINPNAELKADTATNPISSVSNKQTSTLTGDDGSSLTLASVTVDVVPTPDLQLPLPPRSLMDRILNRQGEVEQDEQYLSSEEDIGQTDQSTFVNLLLAQGASDSISVAEPPLDLVISAVLSGVVKDATISDNVRLIADFNSRPNTFVFTKTSSVAKPLENNDDHVFIKPTLPITRGLVAHRSHRARRDSRASRTKPLRRYSPSAPSIAKPVDSRSFIRRTFSPHLFQTCRDIMTQERSANPTANIPRLKAMLKQSLKHGMMTVRGVSAIPPPKETLPSATDSQLLGWGSVIGNGKGLFTSSSRKESEELRIEQRRAIVSGAYARLNLPPPRENWDVSSQVILGGLSFKSFPEMASARNSGRWTTAMEEAMDRISSHVGCNYCRRTFNNRSGLANHLQHCSMARRQTSVSNDHDGDSTASESEDQREARCPNPAKAAKALPAPKVVSESENSEHAEDDDAEDEEGVIMCVCGTKDDEGAMVQCDKCEVWLHLECLDLTEDEVPEEYFCPTCLGLPTPSTGGKSFRHVPSKSSRRKSRQRKDSRALRSLSLSATSDSEFSVEHTLKHDERLQSPQHSPLPESEPEYGREDSQISEDEHDSPTGESAVSPQVVLNHDWDQEALDPSSDLGFDGEYMSSLYGMTGGARAIFKKPRAPALMLDGSSSQNDQVDMMAPLLSSDLGIEDFESLLSEGGHPPSMGLDLCSDGDLTFSDSQYSQSSQYLQATESLFEQGYITALDNSPDLTLSSEDTIDSEGYRTPVDLRRDIDQVEHWTMDPFANDYGPDACTGNHLKRATATDAVDWYQDAPGEEFDLDGLVDLGAVST